MFERFTDRARRVVVLAQEEARVLGHNYIGTEHVLLGLVAENEGVAAKALEALGVDLLQLRRKVEEKVGLGKGAVTGHVPFTPRAKKVLELSLREALQLGHNYIGTEHLLLGLLREGQGVGAQVLAQLGVELPQARDKVAELLGRATPTAAPATEARGQWAVTIRDAPVCPQCAEPVREATASAPIETRHRDGPVIRFIALSCPACGAVLGALPAPPES